MVYPLPSATRLARTLATLVGRRLSQALRLAAFCCAVVPGTALLPAVSAASDAADISSLEQLLYAQQASDIPADEIYQVELLVFAQGSFDASGQRARAGGELFASRSAQLDYGEPQQPLYRNTDLEQLRPLFAQRQAILAGYHSEPGPAATATGTESLDTGSGETPAQAAEQPPAPPPQLMLGDSAALAAQARQLRRAGGYRILFQGRWHQHLLSRKQAPWIPLSGGQPVAGHHELEGAIKLSRDRYLHITTDLWRNNFASSASARQPALPGSALQSLRDDTDSAPVLTLPAPPDPSLALLDIVERWYRQRFEQLTGEPANESDGAGRRFGASNQGTMQVTAAAQLQQYRRMRSGEIHYIDHPLLGIVIRLTPWDSEAQAQQAMR